MNHDLCARVMIESGAIVDQIGPQQFTALMFTALNGHKQCARLLIDAGAQKNAKSVRGETALDIARRKGHAALLEGL